MYAVQPFEGSPLAARAIDFAEQAGDLGTLPETELMRSQYQPIWIEELDAVIAKLKGKTS